MAAVAMQSSLVAFKLKDKPSPTTESSSSLSVRELKSTTFSVFKNVYHTDVQLSFVNFCDVCLTRNSLICVCLRLVISILTVSWLIFVLNISSKSSIFQLYYIAFEIQVNIIVNVRQHFGLVDGFPICRFICIITYITSITLSLHFFLLICIYGSCFAVLHSLWISHHFGRCSPAGSIPYFNFAYAIIPCDFTSWIVWICTIFNSNVHVRCIMYVRVPRCWWLTAEQ